MLFSEQEFAKGAIKQLKDFQLKKNVAPDTTHVVAGSARRTLNVLHGITQGCWIVSPKWVFPFCFFLTGYFPFSVSLCLPLMGTPFILP